VWSTLTSLKTLKIVECSIKVDDEPGGDGAVGFGLLPPSTFLSIEGRFVSSLSYAGTC
jgi:hypothetical protein